MLDQPADIDDEQVSAWLTEHFGDRWMIWNAGPAGIPGGKMWAQFRDDTDGKKVMVGMLLLADGITSARLRAIPVGVLEMGAFEAMGTGEQFRAELAKLPPLVRDGLSPDEFYGRVALHYRLWARFSPNPVRDMAKESGEKSPTVHAWVNRARTRGLLPEAERGKRARG